jgi:hypothetical protein
MTDDNYSGGSRRNAHMADRKLDCCGLLRQEIGVGNLPAAWPSGIRDSRPIHPS